MAASFWAHSYKARRLAEAQQEKREREHQQRVIAEAALAGWRFQHRMGDWECWDTWDPDGNYHGQNPSLYGAAKFALGTMNGSWTVAAGAFG